MKKLLLIFLFFATTTHAQLRKTVYGYLPYWVEPQNIHWNLISHLVCFSVECDQNGNITEQHGWPWTQTISTAHSSNVKVLLTLTCSGDIHTLLSNEDNTNKLFDQLLQEVVQGNADGVNIDFEGDGQWLPQYPCFLSELSSYLKSRMPRLEISCALYRDPNINPSKIVEICDESVIMAYDVYGQWSPYPGGSAPLLTVSNLLKTKWADTIAKFPNKLLLGVPYYGQHWITATNSRSRTLQYIGWVPYSTTLTYGPDYQPHWDTISSTPFYTHLEGTNWHQIWYDNKDSLCLKYNLVDIYKLSGISIWALTYDGQSEDLWSEIDAHFDLH